MNVKIRREIEICKSKEYLATYGAVAVSLMEVYHKFDKVQDFYFCPVCNGFHLTSKGKKWRRERIQQMIESKVNESKLNLN